VLVSKKDREIAKYSIGKISIFAVAERCRCGHSGPWMSGSEHEG
jgi:hypothetical protein